ncbi:MAG: hypothetical protein JWN04_930 [Myxococcaceae bacterium]|nr:hypothetical protein [Myxococcaceae bacterium]
MRRLSSKLPSAVSGLGLAALVLIAREPGTAHALGVEDTVNGTMELGRQANHARVNDFMAVWQNPANLAIVPGRDQGLDLRMPMFNGCFTRAQDPSKEYLSTESFKKSCTSGPGLTGNIGLVLPLPKNFGFGIGLYTPAGSPNFKFGGSDINTINPAPSDAGLTTSGKQESPGRYLLVNKTVNAAFLMVGAGYAPTRYLRLGVSVGSGIINVAYKNVTSLVGGSFTDQELTSNVQVTDAFVPRATASVAATPMDSVDLMASFTWNDDVKAKGSLDVVANGLNAPRTDCGSAMPGPHCRVKNVTLNIPYQRYEVVIGGRYAKRNKPREKVIDPMKDEVWDVEVNAQWSQTGHVDNYSLDIWSGAPGSAAQRNIQISTAPGTVVSPLPKTATLFHGWRDSYALRLGGDYNVMQNFLAVRAGISYESSGVPAKNMNIDYWPVQKVTLSCGATIKLKSWKISAAYAHAFNQSVNTPVGSGNVKEVVALNMPAAQAVNEGKYTSHLNVLSLQGNYTF